MSKNRKLASIQYIHGVSPIEGADRIELVKVLGWQCVANKGQFKEGDLCVYFEVDSFLPICKQFEFLRASSYKNSEILGEGFKLKTMKFRGQISQGLVQPISILEGTDYHIGDDVTEALGVRQWVVEEKVTDLGTIINDLPSYIPHTEEMRIQSYPDMLDEFKSCGEYYITTKMDGTSVTMWKYDGEFRVGGHNYEYADDGKSSVWAYAHKVDLASRLSGMDYVAMQGEFCAAGIQKNRLRLTTPEWYVFNAIDLKTGERYPLDDLIKLCADLGLKTVPIEERKSSFEYSSVDELLERAKGNYTSGMRKEGIVIRPTVPVYSPTIRTALSTKVLNNEYLLKE